MQNVGAFFRNADGSGFDKIFLTGYTPIPPRNEISKTALWSQKTIDWEYYSDPIEILSILKKDGFKILSIELDKNSKDYRELFFLWDEKICLILGNEVVGVNRKILDISDEIYMIPMLGKKESLNVSVAWWIVMYACLWGFKK